MGTNTKPSPSQTKEWSNSDPQSIQTDHNGATRDLLICRHGNRHLIQGLPIFLFEKCLIENLLTFGIISLDNS